MRFQAEQGVARSSEEVEDAVQAVLGRPEFDDSPGWFMRLLDWIGGLFEGISPAAESAMGRVVQGLLFLLVALLLILVVLLFLRLVKKLVARERGTEAAAVRVARRVDELMAKAREVRAAGDHARALRYLLLALVVGLGQRGDLRFRDSWTNRELLDRGEPKPRVRALLAPLIDELEAKEFGREPVTPADIDRLEDLCLRWLGGETPA